MTKIIVAHNNTLISKGRTALSLAGGKSCDEVIEQFVGNKSININSQDKGEWWLYSISWVVRKSHVGAANLLICCGFFVSVIDKDTLAFQAALFITNVEFKKLVVLPPTRLEKQGEEIGNAQPLQNTLTTNATASSIM